MATSIRLTKSNGREITVSVERYIDRGNWIQLKHFPAKRIYSEYPSFFEGVEDMFNGETQLTLKDDVELTTA